MTGGERYRYWRSLPGRRGGSRAIAGAAGALAGLGHAPFSFAVATLAGFVVVMALLVWATTVKRAALLGWLCGLGYFGVTLNWIVQPFLVDAARHGWMAPFGLVFLAGGLALFWAAAFAAAAWLAPRRVRPVVLILTLTAAEWARGNVLTGFPWAMPAYAWSETPLIHAAAVVGPYGLTLATLALAAGIVTALLRVRSALWVLFGAMPLAAAASVGIWHSQGRMIEEVEAPIVRLVQPNAPQDEKWDPERAVTFVERQIALSASAPPADLVIWPETAIPWYLDEAGPILTEASAAVGGVPLILGAMRTDGSRVFNSLVVLGEEGEVVDLYDKHHLVPFGEFIPLGGLARMVGLRSFAARDGYGFSAGPGPVRLDLGPLGRPLPLICYEAIFPSEVGSGARPDWLLQITNDAWFGTFSGPYQHLTQARFRAVEQGVPMIRVANTGISAVIDARGRIVTSLPLGVGGYVDAALPPVAPPTLYSTTGDTPVMVLLALGLAASLFARMR